MPEKARVHIFICGGVQGVFFRANTVKIAKELGLAGWVRNTPDGKVEAVFEGDKEKIEKIIEWSEKGPPFAKVTKIDIEWEKYRGEFDDFVIRYD